MEEGYWFAGITIFPPHVFCAHADGFPWVSELGVIKTRMMGLPDGKK